VVQTAHGEFRLVAYRDQTAGGVHLALSRGDISPEEPTLVRVHISSILRDMVGSELPGQATWGIGKCLKAVADNGRGVVVLLSKEESAEQLLASIDAALGETSSSASEGPNSHTTVGLGSQILKDLGVGKIHLMGAPIKYNAISGFDLEVQEFVNP
jgi:3,4-dihydroxy 2-butanone 4-phosphate synthase/GTP cyclohydrolase II